MEIKQIDDDDDVPGSSEIGGRGEERDGSPIMFRSNLIFPQLFRQIRSSYHGRSTPLPL